MFDAQGR
jgi:pre-mRNA-splicing factor ISY1